MSRQGKVLFFVFLVLGSPCTTRRIEDQGGAVLRHTTAENQSIGHAFSGNEVLVASQWAFKYDDAETNSEQSGEANTMVSVTASRCAGKDEKCECKGGVVVYGLATASTVTDMLADNYKLKMMYKVRKESDTEKKALTLKEIKCSHESFRHDTSEAGFTADTQCYCIPVRVTRPFPKEFIGIPIYVFASSMAEEGSVRLPGQHECQLDGSTIWDGSEKKYQISAGLYDKREFCLTAESLRATETVLKAKRCGQISLASNSFIWLTVHCRSTTA